MRYKITDETLKMGDLTLHRIEATERFSVGVIPGDKGGWIEKESNLQENAWVDGDAVVTGNARIFDNGTIRDNAKVYGNAIVRGCSKVMPAYVRMLRFLVILS